MGLIKLEKGQILHKAGKDIVSTVEVLVKGSLKISNPYSSITAGVGTFIGIVEHPGKPYNYTIEAIEESSVYSYPYESIEDIPKIVRSNPKIAPILAAQSTDTAARICAVYDQQFDEVIKEYEQLMADYTDYPNLCIKVGEVVKEFPELEAIIPPERINNIPKWAIDFINSLKENEELMKKNLYPINVEIAIGMIMSTFNIYNTISDEVVLLNEYRKTLKKRTTAFNTTMTAIKTKLAELEKAENGEGDGEVRVVNALATILSYSGVSGEVSGWFEDLIAQFKANENRYDSSDEARLLRKNIQSTFYDIYLPAFMRSLTDDNIPIEVKMFFMFGFVDEELAGEKNTTILYNMAKSYTPDPEGNIFTVYEWLKMIFMQEAEPSKNEFDQDWPTYLRDQKNSGTITEERMEAMLNNPQKKLDFELRNLFALGNRMTFGRVTSFVPVFDAQNVLRPLDMAYITAAKINEYYEKIRSIDYSVFCRQAVYSNPEIGITQVYYDEDITPIMILMPNVGSRAALWQDIDGKNRRTRARMLVSIFNTENTEEALIKLFGEFRWEMCKTVQGVHWNDVTDPSLTSMYCDYLQFFKKNSALSADNKEKLKTDLKKFSNNFKHVFIADYLSYIKYESAGSPRLNKVAREILFTFCPFSKEIREKLSDNPQYSELINHHNARIGNIAKPISNLIHRLTKEGIHVPAQIAGQLEYLQK
jgi:hypothetical protein